MSLQPSAFSYQLDAKTSVAMITLNRPERLNALTFEVYTQLRDTFRALDTEPGVRAIIITGAGRAFCSGGDVEDIIGALLGRDLKALQDFTRLTCDLILAMRRCRRPIVGAPSQASPDVIYAFGHGHVGMTAAPMTGRIVADLLSGRPASIDIAPFAAARFA